MQPCLVSIISRDSPVLHRDSPDLKRSRCSRTLCGEPKIFCSKFFQVNFCEWGRNNMKKCQPLLKLIPVILLRVLSKWHQWVSLIQLSASFVSSSTSPCALSFSLGKNHIGLSSVLYHFPNSSEVISFLGQHTRNSLNGTGKYSEVHLFRTSQWEMDCSFRQFRWHRLVAVLRKPIMPLLFQLSVYV